MKNILCDKCKKIVGSIEVATYIECDDRYYGVEILCKECKSKQKNSYWEFRSKTVNILLDNQK